MYAYLIAFLLIGKLNQTNSYRVLKFVKMECAPNPKFITNAICRLKPINRYKTVCHMDSDIVGALRNVSLHFEILVRNYANQYNPFLVNVTNNVCEILAKKNFAVYSTIILKILSTVSNVNHSCPFKNHLTVKNLYLEESFFPVAIPDGLYKGIFQFLEGYPYENIGTVTFYVQVFEKKN